jgi:hypothetical protein
MQYSMTWFTTLLGTSRNRLIKVVCVTKQVLPGIALRGWLMSAHRPHSPSVACRLEESTLGARFRGARFRGARFPRFRGAISIEEAARRKLAELRGLC